jgi:hypothetical protein
MERTRRKKYYKCKFIGCDSNARKNGLCSVHYKAQNDIPNKKLGRPAKAKKCSLCNETSFSNGFCKNHYDKFSYYRRTKKVTCAEDFISKIKDNSINFERFGYEGKSGERYIRLNNDCFTFFYKRKVIKQFSRIEDAIIFRDKFLSVNL